VAKLGKQLPNLGIHNVVNNFNYLEVIIMKNYKEIFISPSKDGVGIECLADGETHYLGNFPTLICSWLQDHGVETASHSSCMEFATECGFKNDHDALELWNEAWDRYENKYKLSAKENNYSAVEQFSQLQKYYSPYAVS